MAETEQQIVMVTGKGGVGKSTVAAALALIEARRGKRVLLAELGEKSFLQYALPGAGGAEPRVVTDSLLAVRWSAEACLREYLLYYLRVGRLVDLFFNNRVMRSFINAAPALNELALLGKITSGPRGVGPAMPYDVVVVDAYATGHFKSLCLAPVGMAEAIRFGPMGEQSRSMIEVLRRPATKVVVVTLPEELPVNETVELCGFLAERMGVKARVVINRNLSLPLSAGELESARSKLKVMPEEPRWALEFVDYLLEQGRRQDDAAVRIGELQLPTMSLPFYLQTQWPELLRSMSADLERQWPTG